MNKTTRYIVEDVAKTSITEAYQENELLMKSVLYQLKVKIEEVSSISEIGKPEYIRDDIQWDASALITIGKYNFICLEEIIDRNNRIIYIANLFIR